MTLPPKTDSASVNEGAVLTKAMIRAADRLGVSQKILAAVIGVSEPVVSRMRKGTFTIERASGKPFELAALFIRLYRSLDAIVDGDESVARAWLKNDNTALQNRPIDLIQKVQGLLHVIQYLDARRAPI
ncbi:hypothetical protein ASC80_21300 [Afipia sp. Root123D2]|uniref:MbcA/ParS/Xre antitoxin family protein n=1 Tax=Afipia sp. Root123D2 TaxID=1736436 RepID=UPI0006F7D1FA|nr:MbcA/ParS/Xre antitoxin family protein [Afipia sp. Root123D2]KQW18544.1 hypothetical protein ASC80_21300 [Afipia sp. Root123D2]